MVPPLACFASRGNYPVIRMMKSEWFPLFNVLPVGQLSNDQDDEIGMVPPLAYFVSGGELYNDQDDEVVPFTRLGGIGLKCIYPWGRGGRLMR